MGKKIVILNGSLRQKRKHLRAGARISPRGWAGSAHSSAHPVPRGTVIGPVFFSALRILGITTGRFPMLSDKNPLVTFAIPFAS